MLERWRERDVFRESLRRRAGRAGRGSSTRGRRPPTAGPARTTSSRASSRTSTRATRRCAATSSSARAAGTCHGLPVEIAVEQRARHRHRRTRSRPTASPSSTRSAASRSSSTSRSGTRLTERIGFWVDLDDAYRTLDPTYIESVWWALRQICDKGLLYEGHKVVPYCPRCGTALSCHEVALGYQRRRRPVASTSASRSPRTAARCRPATSCSSGRRRRGRSSPTPPSPSTPS